MYLCISAKLYELACFFIEVQRLNFWNVIIITVFSRLSTLLYILYYNITHYEFIACRLDVLFFHLFLFLINRHDDFQVWYKLSCTWILADLGPWNYLHFYYGTFPSRHKWLCINRRCLYIFFSCVPWYK